MERHIKYINHMELKALVPRSVDTVIVPVGTVEAHGITPLGTDVIIPEAMADRIGPEVNALVAPSVPYGITRGLVGHPGTIRIGPGVFKSYVSDLLESLAGVGFAKIIVLNGHGGQTDELKDTLFEVSRLTGAKTLLIDWWYETDEICKQILEREGGHAGADETACIMAVDPALVKAGLYDEKMVSLHSKAYSAYPVPGSIIRYAEGDWSLNLDEKKCKDYFEAVTAKVTAIMKEVIRKWETI